MKNSRTLKKRPWFVLPGFGLSLGITITYVTLVVLIPMAALFIKALHGGWGGFWAAVLEPRVVASYRLSFGLSLLAAVINGFFGLLVSWALVRYNFPGRRLMDSLVDLPFALPTAVAGLALTSLYVPNGLIGHLLFQYWGVKVAYTPWGILLALMFVGFPFVVRTLQPVVGDLSLELEEAAACLGASRWITLRRVVFPAIFPALLTGVTLAFGRAVGEFGSVVFISGNLPFKTEITPWMITTKLEEYDYNGAAAIGFVMVLASFVLLGLVNLLQWWNARHMGRVH